MYLRKFGEANVAKPRLTDANGTSAKKKKRNKQTNKQTKNKTKKQASLLTSRQIRDGRYLSLMNKARGLIDGSFCKKTEGVTFQMMQGIVLDSCTLFYSDRFTKSVTKRTQVCKGASLLRIDHDVHCRAGALSVLHCLR